MITNIKDNDEEFANIAFVSDLLDVVILEDLMDAEGEIDETPEHTVPCYALGQPPEEAAGLRSTIITPFFDSEAGLDEFLGKYMDKFKKMAEDETLAFVDDNGVVIP